MGLFWLVATIGFGATAVLALAVSQVLIIANFKEARFGTIANAIILVPIALSLADLRPSSLRSGYVAVRPAVVTGRSTLAVTIGVPLLRPRSLALLA